MMRISENDRANTDRTLTVCITFDNLGEAAEIEYGLLPDDVTTGSHPSATRGIPVILDLLQQHEVQATFFVEGWNGDRYPDTIAAIAAGDHEIGFHGWRHENWSRLGEADARRLADRSLDALHAHVQPCLGMRPPGGGLTAEACSVLAERGITYVSPLGDTVGAAEGLVVLPFAWRAVDALYFEPTMGSLRAAILGHEEVRSDPAWAEGLRAVLREALDRGGLLTVIFHAYLLADQPRRVAILDEFLQVCRNHPAIVTRRMDDVARTATAVHDCA